MRGFDMGTWILLRGWTREKRHWEDFPEHLAAFVPGADARAIDLPGAGQRHTEKTPSSIARIVQEVRDDAACRNGAGPLSLVGLSLGGLVAMEWAREHPAEIERLVLINTSARPYCHMTRRLRPSNYATIVRLMLAPPGPRRESGILQLTTTRPPDPDRIARWDVWARQLPVSRVSALRQLAAATAYRAPAAPPCNATLVLASAADRLVDPRCSRDLARAWNLPFAMHPSAGHDLPLDDGPWVAAQVARWLGAAMP
jgi:pimeloyl-ACP methyl ester carboxylesterase